MTAKSRSFTGDLHGILNLFWRVDKFCEEKRTTKLDKQSFSPTQMKRNLMMITLFFRKYITKLIGNTIKMPYIG